MLKIKVCGQPLHATGKCSDIWSNSQKGGQWVEFEKSLHSCLFKKFFGMTRLKMPLKILIYNLKKEAPRSVSDQLLSIPQIVTKYLIKGREMMLLPRYTSLSPLASTLNPAALNTHVDNFAR